MEMRTARPPKDYTPMAKADRAKQFAPFEALGSMDELLSDVVRNKQKEGIEHIQNLEDFNYICAEDMDFEDIEKWQKDLN